MFKTDSFKRISNASASSSGRSIWPQPVFLMSSASLKLPLIKISNTGLARAMCLDDTSKFMFSDVLALVDQYCGLLKLEDTFEEAGTYFLETHNLAAFS
jgi:hypothetical protein